MFKKRLIEQASKGLARALDDVELEEDEEMASLLISKIPDTEQVVMRVVTLQLYNGRLSVARVLDDAKLSGIL